MRKLLIAIAIFALFFLIVISFIPIVGGDVYHFAQFHLTSLDEARSYYTIVSALSAVLTSVIGLGLGYLYFSDRRGFDQRVLDNQRLVDFARQFLDCHDKYEEAVELILLKRCSSDVELDKFRAQMLRSWNHLERLLNCPPNADYFSKEERDSFLTLNSFIDRNDIICQIKLADLKLSDVQKIHQQCINRFLGTRNICVRKLVLGN